MITRTGLQVYLLVSLSSTGRGLKMQTGHTVSLERSVQVRGESYGYMRPCGVGCLHSLMMKAVPGSQESIEIGVPVASASQGRARPSFGRSWRLLGRAFTSGLFVSTNFVSGWNSLYINRTIMVNSSKGNENEDNRRLAPGEDSPFAKEEVMMLFYQLEIEKRLQRALNQDEYETAQVLREKIAEFEKVLARKKQERMGSLSPKQEVQDTSIKILQLRTELQKNIEQENYSGAARMRDKIAELEADALLAAAKEKIYKNIKYAFRLGQKVKRKTFGYMGVICGMDPVCFESADWIQQNAVEEQLRNGVKQPFYQVLVDVQTNPSNLVAYVAEENLQQLAEPHLERFEHPYTYYLFYGIDSAGDFIPTRHLREKYSQPRHEIPYEDGQGSPAGNDGDSD